MAARRAQPVNAAPSARIAQRPAPAPTVPTRQPTPEEQAAAISQGKLNQQRPVWNGQSYTYVPMTAAEINAELQRDFDQSAAPVAPALPTLPAFPGRGAPPAPAPTIQQRFSAAPAGTGAGGFNTALATAAPARPLTVVQPTFDARIQGLGSNGTLPGSPTSANPEAGGPAEVDRQKIDAILGNVSRANSGILGIAANNQQYSQAQAQLALGTAQSQQNALALARSGNRRDAAALGARALQTNAEMGAEATRSAALLRGQEEDANRRLKLDAFKAAGDLGLNAAALEVDVNNLNMQAATQYLNQLFETNRLGLQLDEAEAARVTNFTRDMALIAKDYYSLSMQERQSVRDDLTRRYGISEQTKAVLAQLDAQPGFWEQAALGLVGGAGQGASAALTSSLLGPAAAPATAAG